MAKVTAAATASSSTAAPKSTIMALFERTKNEVGHLGEDTSNVTDAELEKLAKAVEVHFDVSSLFLWTELNEKDEIRAWIKQQTSSLGVSGATLGLLLTAYAKLFKKRQRASSRARTGNPMRR